MTASETEPDTGQPPTPVLLLCAPICCYAPIAPHPSPTCTPWPVPPDTVSIQIASVGAELNCRAPSWCGGASGCVQSPPYMPGITSQVCSRARTQREAMCVFLGRYQGVELLQSHRSNSQYIPHVLCFHYQPASHDYLPKWMVGKLSHGTGW